MATPLPGSSAAVSSEPQPKASKADGKADGKAAGKADGKADGKVPKPAAGDAPKKLSGAELKALKQAEKAKRRAAVIAAKQAAGAQGTPVPTAAGGDGGGQTKQGGPGAGGGGSGGKGKGKQNTDGAGSTGPAAGQGSGAGGLPIRRQSAAAADREKEREREARTAVPECFSHLAMAKRISIAQAHKDVHPAILAVGQQMSTFTLRDNVARLEATMVAFKKVIQSYRTPPGNAFSRHFVAHVLNPQIEYLTECRPMCFAMGNAIRLLKARVSQLDLDLDDKDAISQLCEDIDSFIQERVYVAAIAIAREAANMVCDGDVILTYGGPRLVRAALEQAWENGVQFDLIIVDDPLDPAAGQDLAKLFRHRPRPGGNSSIYDADEVNVTYSASLDGIDGLMGQAYKVFLGVESVFANGALLAPAGTYDVALSAQEHGVPTLALCETVNFDRDRVATDAFAHNEIDPDSCNSEAFRLLFDVTQPNLISMLITEYEEASGMVPAHSVYSVLRTKEDPN